MEYQGHKNINGCVLVKPYFLFFFLLLHEIHKNCMIFRLFSRHRKLGTLISHFSSFNSHSEDSPTQSDHEEYGKVDQAHFDFTLRLIRGTLATCVVHMSPGNLAISLVHCIDSGRAIGHGVAY